jgi:hypothetical protein
MFYIFDSMHYNSISVILTNKCTQAIVCIRWSMLWKLSNVYVNIYVDIHFSFCCIKIFAVLGFPVMLSMFVCKRHC